MIALWHETGETIWVSAPSGLFAVFLDVAESPAAVRYAARPGKRSMRGDEMQDLKIGPFHDMCNIAQLWCATRDFCASPGTPRW